MLSGAWHGLTIALLAIGFIGSQLRRGDRRAPWLAWTGVVLVLIGLVTVVQALIAGFVVFGVALTVGGRRERLPGVLLTLGGVTFLVTLATSAPFWGEGSPQWEGGPLLAYTAALTLIALAIAATALVETRARTAQLRGTGSTVPG